MTEYDRYLVYFKPEVLSSYCASPHEYKVDTDDMGGVVMTISKNVDDNNYFEKVRFGYRTLINGKKVLTAFGLDISRLPLSQKHIWRGFLIEPDNFVENDIPFERWVNRCLGGSFQVDDGPTSKIESTVKLIRAITKYSLGVELFKFEENQLFNYPVSESREAYIKAHLEVYRLLIDGISSEAEKKLAEKLHVTLSNPTRTLISLKELLPEDLQESLHKALKVCVDARNENHGVPSAGVTRPFAAHTTFHDDIVNIANGLNKLLTWLESIFKLKAKDCLEHEEFMNGLYPVFIGPPRPGDKAGTLAAIIGRTVSSVKIGEVKSYPETHQGEAIAIHFTDGAVLSIQTGSNAVNITEDRPDMTPNDFETDLMVFFSLGPNKNS